MRGKKNAPNLTIDFQKLLRQKKWNAEKIGRLALYVALYDIVNHGKNYPIKAVEFYNQKLDMLEEEDNYEFTEYCEIWEPLPSAIYKLHNNAKNARYKFSTSISALTEAIKKIRNYNIIKNSKNIQSKEKNIVFSLIFDSPENMTIQNERITRDLIAALKMRRAINKLYKILSENYDEKILLLVGTFKNYYDEISVYETNRAELIKNNVTYFNKPIIHILPHINITKTEIETKIVIDTRRRLRRPIGEYDPAPDLANIDFYLGDLFDGHRRIITDNPINNI